MISRPAIPKITPGVLSVVAVRKNVRAEHEILVREPVALQTVRSIGGHQNRFDLLAADRHVAPVRALHDRVNDAGDFAGSPPAARERLQGDEADRTARRSEPSDRRIPAPPSWHSPRRTQGRRPGRSDQNVPAPSLAMNRIACGSVMHDVTPCAMFHRGPIWWPSACERPSPALVSPKTDSQAPNWHCRRCSSCSVPVADKAAARCARRRERPARGERIAQADDGAPSRSSRPHGQVRALHLPPTASRGVSQRHRGIEKHSAWTESRIRHRPLDPRLVIGNPHDRCELTGRECRGDGDVHGPFVLGRGFPAPCQHCVDGRLHGIDRTAAAEADHAIGLLLLEDPSQIPRPSWKARVALLP